MNGCRLFPVFLLVTGCVDLSAVRDFAKTSSQITANEPVIAGWPKIYDHAREVASSPDLKKAAPGQEKELEDAASDAQKYTPIAEKAAMTLSLYMKVLASLADDKLPDVSSQADSIDKSLVALKVESSNAKGLAAAGSAGTILKLLEIPLDLWRQHAVREVILNSDKDVQILTEFLASTADEVNSAEAEVGRTLTKYFEVSSLSSRDNGVRAQLRRIVWKQDADTANLRRQAATATAAFTAIGKDHAVLAKNADKLSGALVKSTLENDAPLLENARKIFGQS